MYLHTLIGLNRKSVSLELSAILQSTGKNTPLAIDMRFTTAVLALGISRAQDNCLNELALVSAHTGPKSKTRCISGLGFSRIESCFCFDDVGGCGAEGEGIAEADVFLGNHAGYGGSESTEEDTTVDHCGCWWFGRMQNDLINVGSENVRMRDWKTKVVE